jgi:hypothetical protein
MVAPSQYWLIQKIPIAQGSQLKHIKEISTAKEFFNRKFPSFSNISTLSKQQNKQIQTVLWEIFRCDGDIYQQALAGLCLRCYVSRTILNTCKQIPHIYNVSAENLFNYTDFLGFVLNDDGKALVIVDSDGKTQYRLNNTLDTVEPLARGGKLFSVEILQKFNPNLDNHESLDSWAKRLTRQNENIKSFLWEFGLATPTDWGLLCKSIPYCMSSLFSKQQYEIIKAFKTVYQRDRLSKKEKGRCLQPTPSQLQEMQCLLDEKNVTCSTQVLISDLKGIAEILRQDWLSRKTGSPKTLSTEAYDSTNDRLSIGELPLDTQSKCPDLEFEELQQRLDNLFEQVLYQAIAQEIKQRIQNLEKSRAYKRFAQLFPQGLRLYYQENKSLSEIAQEWSIEWNKARRILKLEDFLELVQYRTEEIFLDQFLQLVDEYKYTEITHEPDDLRNIAILIREFIWNKTFKQASSEFKASKKQIKNSLFAQAIRNILMD